MRIYIFGNDGITLNREPPAAVSESLIELISRQTFDFPPPEVARMRRPRMNVTAGRWMPTSVVLCRRRQPPRRTCQQLPAAVLFLPDLHDADFGVGDFAVELRRHRGSSRSCRWSGSACDRSAPRGRPLTMILACVSNSACGQTLHGVLKRAHGGAGGRRRQR